MIWTTVAEGILYAYIPPGAGKQTPQNSILYGLNEKEVALMNVDKNFVSYIYNALHFYFLCFWLFVPAVSFKPSVRVFLSIAAS